MGPPPPAPLPDELVEEILLRIPPSDPATLARAAVAQKRWCRLVAGPGFCRRYRDRHRAPPMLGFFCFPWSGNGFSTSFVPASSFRPKPRADRRQLGPVDARHGRVLLRAYERFRGGVVPGFRLVVWDPITRHRVALPRPKGLCDEWEWSATVLCAAPAGSCDHLDCHSGHFIVVLISNYPEGMLSCVYSSQAGAWGKIARHLYRHSLGYEMSSAHVGNALYCMLDWGNKILRFDLRTREFSVMEPPVLLSRERYTERIQLTTMEDGQLALAVLRKSTLYILSTDEEFGWGGTNIIDLEKCGNYVPSTTTPSLIGFAGDIGLVFLNTGNNGILSVDIRSAQVKVVDKRPCISRIVPYINFCTPALGAAFRGEGPSEGGSNE
ncbi:uncharacterized protein [Miscanthus floridulus]|uniref:uncharacterized protein n=1 Tax=Miscanthus floridulus TaxID=154761 RepID=UPI003459897B